MNKKTATDAFRNFLKMNIKIYREIHVMMHIKLSALQASKASYLKCKSIVCILPSVNVDASRLRKTGVFQTRYRS